ncbi:DUF3263 domain-containing protein [Dactylosporangium aurantiacum]|uniref:DUF3263 domain-containing protein n=1 Tax=Dactylosporangium aurantiacum TaxID=35754 RepID=A0A9Q9ILD5_9ACTN|nr:DUF3263 domain-containing protein [Dactylosporangium aurantiacum]MDG6100783.1 DUF3263 domain-containing protein [Dactylosporangium aurantiacum]UWZ55153.1 DUF3263 domain-containing protein [Dactylosporangium aurantiacum]
MQRDDLAATRVPAQPSTHDDFLDTDLDADLDTDLDADLDGAEGDGGLDVAAVEEPPELDERGKRILDFERRWWRQAGAKEQAIRDTFNLSATRYYQLLNALLDDPLALAHEPVVVQRLRRLRASRSRRR